MPQVKVVTNYEKIKTYLNDKLPYTKFSQRDQAFFDDFEEDLADAMDKMDILDRTDNDKKRYQDLKVIYDNNQKAVEHEKQQMAKAHLVKDGLQEEYKKQSWFSRTFSHLIPNSWTKAGRLRDEIKSCDKAYKDCGYNPKSLESQYHRNEQIKGGDDGTLMDYQEKENAEKSAWTKKGKEANLRELSAKTKIGSGLESDKFMSGSDKQKIEIIEAGELNKQEYNPSLEKSNNEQVVEKQMGLN